MINLKIFRIVIAAVAIGLPQAGALAATALAVGVTERPVDGVAFGTAWNYKTEETARAAALDQCHAYKNAPKAASFCKEFQSIANGCLSIAFDPKDDSPGMGWSVARDRDTAERQALDTCRERAPASRRDFCKVVSTRCDGDPVTD